MSRQSRERNEKWTKFEEDVLGELREARQRGLLSDSFDQKIEDVPDAAGKAAQAKLLSTLAEQREAEGVSIARSRSNGLRTYTGSASLR